MYSQSAFEDKFPKAASVYTVLQPDDHDEMSIASEKATSLHTGLRRSKRDRKPSQKALDNIQLENEAIDEFWITVKRILQIVREVESNLEDVYSLHALDLSTINRHLRESLEDLDVSYAAIRRTLVGIVPQDVRRYMDKYKAKLEELIQRTAKARHDVIDVHSNSSRDSIGSQVSNASSRKALLVARAASLQCEIDAKSEEHQKQMELRRLEAEVETKKQELENQKIKTELKKTKVELKTLEKETNNHETFFVENLPLRPSAKSNVSPSLNVHASPFFPQHQMSTPAAADTSVVDLLKTFNDSLNLSRLPVPEPVQFHGDPLHYPVWKASFAALIESRQIPSAERIYYMQQYLKGEAREAVEALFYFNTEEAYNSARSILEERYGNPFLVSEAFRDKLDDWPKISGNDPKSLRKLTDFLRQCLTAMSHVEELKILNDCRENRKILQKLPEWLTHRWSRIVAHHNTYPDFKTFVEFLTKEADIVCNPVTTIKTSRSKTTEDPKKGKKKGSTATTLMTESKAGNTRNNMKNPSNENNATKKGTVSLCLYCEKKGHNINQCYQFIGKTPKERYDFIMKNGLCHGCLKTGHMFKECKTKSTCDKCNGKHPTCVHGDYAVLFPGKSATVTEKEDTKPPEKENKTKEPATVTNASQSENKDPRCSMTVPVYISTENDPDNETLVYALLDTQSDTTFISDETVQKLNAKIEPTRLKISTMTSSTVLDCMKLKGLQIRGATSNQRISLPVTYSRDYIPVNRSHIPTPEVARRWPHLRCLEDEILPLQDCEVGLLLGYNCPQALAPLNVKLGGSEDPFAVETKLGWSIVGRVQGIEVDEEHITHCVKVKEEILLPKILRVLESDFTEMKKDEDLSSLSQDDLKFMEIVKSGIHQTEDGFYEMPLPFRDEKPALPNNLILARKRLEHLKTRFTRDQKYYTDYNKFMTDMISNGYAEEAPEENNDTVWYIPHHGVYNPKKPEKIRVVFDCSSRYKETSLNDHLLPGPDLLNSLVGVLCRFREKPVAVMGDVESMFHRFKVNPEDRNYLQFLWWKDGEYVENQPITYRMTVHLFGASSSPGCANYGLKKIASDNKEELSPDVVDYLMKDFYVDDGLRSCDTVEEAIHLVECACKVCKKANVRLHKLISNSREVMKSIPESEQAKEMKSLNINFDDLPIEKVLGMQWNVESDCFQFRVTIDQKPMTRRGVLSTVVSVYDPLGCLAPFVLIGKQIVQQMCRENLSWDDHLPEDLRPKWEKWITDLPKLSVIQIPRCLIPEDFGTIVHRELHHFSDASFSGYGECSYIRVVNDKNDVHCALVMGKARVAPLKVLTIPRLELMAAVVAIKMSKILEHELRDPYEHHFWTDSKIVLGYIGNDARKFRVYVANRVQMIRDASEVQQWHYTNTKDNPADHASRGLYANELSTSNWFTGPDFLKQPDLPTSEPSEIEISEEDPEVKQASTKVTKSEEDKPMLEKLKRFSDWSRAVLALSTLMKIVSCKKNGLKLDVKSTTEEIVQAEKVIIKWIQENTFSAEIEALSKSPPESVPKKSKLFKLSPFVDSEGILRVGGRMDRSSLSYDIKHPIILPNAKSTDGHMIDLLIKHHHEKMKHQGRGFTINALRGNGFWILGCSKAVSTHIFNCVTCRKLRGPKENQKMADLPSDRIEESAPFSHCGIDCFGPFVVKEGRRELKKYALMISCMASRAIHLEMLDDMSTDCFINALRCLIAIRGPVRTLRCDQGSNFVGAKNTFEQSLKEISNERLQKFLIDNRCDFIMNSPKSSHMGGKWERHIRTVRSVLSTMLEHHSQRLDSSSLRTFLYESMSIINNRPLSPQNLNDPQGPEPLTPNHLITMKSQVTLPPPGEFVKEDVYARKRWRRVQFLVKEFWNRWRKEYILNLQARSKWNKEKRNLEVGDIVILKEDDMIRGFWSLARVVETTEDEDGLVRRVKILLGDSKLSASGERVSSPSIFERPVHKLVLLLKV